MHYDLAGVQSDHARVRYSPYGVPEPVLVGDLNHDGVLNDDDRGELAITRASGQTTGVVTMGEAAWNPDADFNFDGVIDEDDALALTGLVNKGGESEPGELWDAKAADFLRGLPIGYAGMMRDPQLGAWLMRNRWHDPELGRFISRDPAGYVDGMSLYAYVSGNPLKYWDPFGLRIPPESPRFRNSAEGRYLEGMRGMSNDLVAPVVEGVVDHVEPRLRNIAAGASAGFLTGAATGGTVGGTVGFFFGGVGAGPGFAAGAGLGGLTGAIDGAIRGLVSDLRDSSRDTAEKAAVDGTIAGAMSGASVPFLSARISSTVMREADDLVEITAPVGQGFSSFSAFKRNMGPAGDGMQWHHIVEQGGGNVDRFGAAVIHNSTNLIRIDEKIHTKISAYYSSKQPFTDGLTVRQWLRNQSFQEHREFGLQVLRDCGVEP